MQLQRGVRLGSRTTYAALQGSGSEVSIARKLGLKVRVATITSLYTARQLRASKGRRTKGT